MALGKIFLSRNIAFKGCDKHLDKTGKPVYTFYYPHSNEYRLQLELLKTSADGKNGNMEVYEIPDKSIDIKDIKDNQKVYYRFKLIDNSHTGKAPVYAQDNGIIKKIDADGDYDIEAAPFTRLFADRLIVSKQGRMQLQIPDAYYPKGEYIGGKYVVSDAEKEKFFSAQRTHVNRLGGTLDGMTSKLSEKANEGYTRIVGTPFTKDEITSHLYWTQNAYQMSSSLGGMQNMKRFQRELFKNGINFVSDASLVNEGLQGIHIASILKWGKASPFFNWFKTYGTDLNTISLGLFPKDSPYVRMRIVNSPVHTAANPVKAEKYNPNLPTYVQLYDSRLVSPELEQSNKIFTGYDKNIDNHYKISSYNDVTMPYAFSVNPKELKANIDKFRAYEKGDFADKNLIKNLLVFSNFKISDRHDGGIELWDGNIDIAKLNFTLSNYDSENINSTDKVSSQTKKEYYKQGTREVRDYAVLSGKYWAKLFADNQLEFAASAFKNVNSVNDALNALHQNAGSVLPKSVLNVNISNNEEIIRNVLNGNYNLFKLNNITTYTQINENDVKIKKNIDNKEDILKKSIMNLPLEVLEVGDDVSSILSSGYLTKRAGTDEQIGLTRFDIYKSEYPNLPQKYTNLYKRTDKLLTQGVYDFVNKVLETYSSLDGAEKLQDYDGQLSDYAKYVINAVAPDLTKYALIKSLDKDANISVENDGGLNFDNIDKSKLTVKALGVSGISPEDEALNLIKKFEKGISQLNSNQAEINKMAAALSVRLNGLNENSFKLADMIVDRTESGMGLRVDAAKDIAAVDGSRNGIENFDKAWADTLDFWSKYVKDGIQAENPHAYSTAEVTDIDKFVDDNYVGKLKSPSEADRIMLEKTGVTSLANYTYLFSMPIDMYSYNPESGFDEGYKKVNNIKVKLDCLDMPEWKDNYGMLFQGPADSSIHSYTFSGNHDKPRILHVLGLDMELYNSKFYDEKSQKAALEVLKFDENSDCFPDEISAPAIAMGKRLKDVFFAMKELSEEEKEKIKKTKKEYELRKEEYIPENDSDNEQERILSDAQYEKITSAIARLATGLYQIGDNEDTQIKFKADSFGQRPFDVVIKDVLKTADLGISEEQSRIIADIALKKMLMPAMEKYKAIYKMLTILPGDVTDFAGDKEASTGFEAKSKNVTQQNRNAVRWDWVEDKNNKNYKPFVVDYKKSMNDIMALRLRPELSALNNGNTVSLVNYNTAAELDRRDERKYAAIFRYNAEGSQVIGIFAPPDLKDSLNPSLPMGSKKTKLKFLNLSAAREREGLAGGLDVGATFVSTNPDDKSVYVVKKQKITVPEILRTGNEYNAPDADWVNDEKKIGYIEKEKEAYVLKRYLDGNYIDIEVDKNDGNALLLYKTNKTQTKV